MVGAAGFGAAATGVAANGKAPPRPSEERSVKRWSGRPDSNRRPPAPKAGALPGCATPRLVKNTLKNTRNVMKPSAAAAVWHFAWHPPWRLAASAGETGGL